MTELFDWLTVKFRLNTLFFKYNLWFFPGMSDVSTIILSLYNNPDIGYPFRTFSVRRTLTTLVTESSLVTLTYRRRRLRVPLTAWVLANQNHLCLFVSRLLKKSLLPFEKKRVQSGLEKLHTKTIKKLLN